ncbi:MAG: hypothetical protein FWG90_13140, partial [Oscillospiraceae bacterium]|nr:hypothetical protein [Oscillospiraceae bacterium]
RHLRVAPPSKREAKSSLPPSLREVPPAGGGGSDGGGSVRATEAVAPTKDCSLCTKSSRANE